MIRRCLTGLTLLLAAVVVAPAQAQSQPAVDEPPAAFLTLNLAAGYPLDPFIVSLNGGGPVDASALGGDCVGYIGESPTLAVNWTGDAEFVEAFFYSDHDPVLVIETPDGDYLCNDDANEHLLDPVIQLDNPAHGEYKIWAGAYDADQLIPGVLVLTTRPEVHLGTFDLGSLVQRPAIARDLVETENPQRPLSATAAMTDVMRTRLAPIALNVDAGPFTTTVTVDGTFPAFEIAVRGDRCNGLLERGPTFVFEWEEESERLRIFFESDLDSTLLVETADGQILCNDDSIAAQIASGESEVVNLNPLVEIAEPVPGRYYVFVGRLADEGEVSGVLTVTGTADATPALLAAPNEAEEEE